MHLHAFQITFPQFTPLVVSAIFKEKVAKGKFLIPLMSMDGSGLVQEILGCHPQINLVKLLSGVILDREYILVIYTTPAKKIHPF